MDIKNTNAVSGIGNREIKAPVGRRGQAPINGKAQGERRVDDTVEISTAGLSLSHAGNQPLAWSERISDIRTSIQEETFETPQRVHETVSILLKVMSDQ